MAEATGGPIAPFTIARLPRIRFGAGAIAAVPEEAAVFGNRALVVTGARSFAASDHWRRLEQGLAERKIGFDHLVVADEPSPELVDDAVRIYHGRSVAMVIAIGGGSVLDAAKAIAGLLKPGNSVLDHLEGVGSGVPYRGPALPLVAVPTTAGTGSEATKNAVLSRRGADGFKKSFRDEALVAAVAVVDPELLASCPPELLAANGMDAFTQLLEGYVSTGANLLTDALAWSGMEAFRDGLFPAWERQDVGSAAAGRARLAYASLLSGIVLAQTGLGSVHGLASPLGAFFPIPHGVVCGTLVAAATGANIEALANRGQQSPALAKYAAVGRLLAQAPDLAREPALSRLAEILADWTRRLALPRLSAYGMGEGDIGRVVAGSRGGSMKTNPLVLTDDELAVVLRERL